MTQSCDYCGGPCVHAHMCTCKYVHASMCMHCCTDRQTDRQMDRQTDGHTGRQPNGPTPSTPARYCVSFPASTVHMGNAGRTRLVRDDLVIFLIPLPRILSNQCYSVSDFLFITQSWKMFDVRRATSIAKIFPSRYILQPYTLETNLTLLNRCILHIEPSVAKMPAIYRKSSKASRWFRFVFYTFWASHTENITIR